MSGKEPDGGGGGAQVCVANIGRSGVRRRMTMGAIAALVAAGVFVGFDADFAGGDFGRWWRLGLLPAVLFSALCVFQAQEGT
jgi:hypothetical protein